jgi:Vacuolar sorting 38 and autophagy-related subunit 14
MSASARHGGSDRIDVAAARTAQWRRIPLPERVVLYNSCFYGFEQDTSRKVSPVVSAVKGEDGEAKHSDSILLDDGDGHSDNWEDVASGDPPMIEKDLSFDDELCAKPHSKADPSPSSVRASGWRPRSQYSTSVLRKVRLQIILPGTSPQSPPVDLDVGPNSKTQLDSIKPKSERILVDLVCSRKSVHPSWLHLDQLILQQRANPRKRHHQRRSRSLSSTSQQALVEAPVLTLDNYSSLLLRFSLVDESQAHESPEIFCRESTLFEVPVHPGKLHKIAYIPQLHDSSGSSGTRGNATPTMIPTNLPVNTVLVYYTDGSVRVPTPIHKVLLASKPGVSASSGVSSAPPTSPVRINTRPASATLSSSVPGSNTSSRATSPIMFANVLGGEDDTILRFEDDAFRALGPLPTVPSIAGLEDEEDDEEGSTSNSEQVSQLDQEAITEEISPHQRRLPSNEQVKKEHVRLQRLLELEQAQRKNDEARWCRERDELQQTVRTCQVLVKQNSEVDQALAEERLLLARTEFLCEAQRILLVRDLAVIYPVVMMTPGLSQPPTSSLFLPSALLGGMTSGGAVGSPTSSLSSSSGPSGSRYLIRGLENPRDPLSGAVPDDVLAAALGYLCHTVMLLSKYLDIPLRYRLSYNSSRSHIHDDSIAVPVGGSISNAGSVDRRRGGPPANAVGTPIPPLATLRATTATYPLYPAPRQNAERREKFLYGMHLLDLNIECLCRMRNVFPAQPHSPSFSQGNMHILAKVKRLYESVIDGY